MKFYHFSKEKLVLDRNYEYKFYEYMPLNKPVGLWISVNGYNGWESFCRSEEYNLEALTYKSTVILNPNANIIKLSKVKDFENFYHTYKVDDKTVEELFGMVNDKKAIEAVKFLTRQRSINWKLVQEDYQGIIIERYSNNITWNYRWVYGWDCISGCIWDLSCIDNVKTRKNPYHRNRGKNLLA